MGSETQPWIKFVLNDWFQFQVKQYFKVITDTGIDTGRDYTEEQKRAMANCYLPAYWEMMRQRERDSAKGFSISREPTVQAYTTYFIEKLGMHMEKMEEIYILCPQCKEPSVTFAVNRNERWTIDLTPCEHIQWYSGPNKDVPPPIYDSYELKKMRELTENDEN